MTKRTAEQTLADDLAKATVEESRAQAAYERAREKLAEAEAASEAAWRLVLSAGERISRVATALEALAPKTLADTPIDDSEEPGAPESDRLEIRARLARRRRSQTEQVEDGLVEIVSDPLDREETIAAAVGTDVETVRKASGRSKS